MMVLYLDVFRFKGLFTLERSKAKRGKDHNKDTSVTSKLQRSNALIYFTEHTRDVEACSSWKRKRWKRLNFCGSGNALKKEAGSGSELGSFWLFEEPGVEAFFINMGQGCGSGSGGSGYVFVEAEALWRKKLEAEAKNIVLLPHPWSIHTLKRMKIKFCYTLNCERGLMVYVRAASRSRFGSKFGESFRPNRAQISEFTNKLTSFLILKSEQYWFR